MWNTANWTRERHPRKRLFSVGWPGSYKVLWSTGSSNKVTLLNKNWQLFTQMFLWCLKVKHVKNTYKGKHRKKAVTRIHESEKFMKQSEMTVKKAENGG